MFVLSLNTLVASRRYVSIEAEQVVRVVLVFERDQTLPIFGRIGGADPRLGGAHLKIVENRLASLVPASCLGQAGNMGLDALGHLRGERRSEGVHREPGVAAAQRMQLLGAAR